MVYNYPFFNFPRPRKYFPYNMPPYYNAKDLNLYNKSKNTNFSNNLFSDSSNKKQKIEASSNNKEAKDEYFFEIFGLKLYFDDILIICLIFFLYKEGVNDEYLFMALILLLLS